MMTNKLTNNSISESELLRESKSKSNTENQRLTEKTVTYYKLKHTGKTSPLEFGGTRKSKFQEDITFILSSSDAKTKCFKFLKLRHLCLSQIIKVNGFFAFPWLIVINWNLFFIQFVLALRGPSTFVCFLI